MFSVSYKKNRDGGNFSRDNMFKCYLLAHLPDLLISKAVTGRIYALYA